MDRVGSDEFLTDDGSLHEEVAGAVPQNNYRFRQMLKLPGFYHKEPAVWFAEVELLFEFAGVNTEKTKAGAVLAALDFETVMTISDIITQEISPVDIYSQIKQRLIANFSVSSESRLRQLLKGELAGEGKPSLILNKIKNLSQGKCGDEIIKTVFLDQLPSNCRAALALSDVKEIDRLAELADRFMEASGQNNSQVSAVASENSHEELLKMIEALSAKVDAISAPNRFRSNQRSENYKRRNRSKSSNNRKFNNNQKFNGNTNFKNQNNNNNQNNYYRKNNNNKNSQLCFYHFNFGDKALKCVSPCAWQNGSASGN